MRIDLIWPILIIFRIFWNRVEIFSKDIDEGNSLLTFSHPLSICRDQAWKVLCRTRSCFWRQFFCRRNQTFYNIFRSFRPIQQVFVHLSSMMGSFEIPLVQCHKPCQDSLHWRSLELSSRQSWTELEFGFLGMGSLIRIEWKLGSLAFQSLRVFIRLD